MCALAIEGENDRERTSRNKVKNRIGDDLLVSKSAECPFATMFHEDTRAGRLRRATARVDQADCANTAQRKRSPRTE
jgi:hypothetical protein